MPYYEYVCLEHNRFTVRQGMFDERVADCPECDKPAEFRISLSNFRVAVPFTLVEDGKIIHYQPDGANIPPPVEDLARDEKKEYQYA